MRAVVLALTIFGSTTLGAQAGTVTGTITDPAGGPIAGATVRVDGLVTTATADASGRYRLAGVPAGTRTVRVRMLGFRPGMQVVEVRAGERTEANFSLQQEPLLLSPLAAVVGSRARHTAADELAVPVDVFTAEQIAEQGTTETSQVLQALAPSVNFPRQSVTDGTDIVRPFTLRGLSPDHTLVLVNGSRRHQTALVNTFAYGTGAGSSGVDLNAIPSSAIDRVEVLRDGAAAQYGSDAIAGVVNIVVRHGAFAPFLNVHTGAYVTRDYPSDGATVNLSGGWGLGLGRGSVALFGEFLDRQPTNRAWADPFEDTGGQPDVIDRKGRVIEKRNPVPQPNHHWGDGLERNALGMANLRYPLNAAGTTELHATAGLSRRVGTGNGYWRYSGSGRNWPEIYPLGFLPEFRPDVTDYSAAGGVRSLVGRWFVDATAAFGHNDFRYNLRNTLNASLGPCLTMQGCTSPAPGPDGVTGTADDMVNQTRFFAGRLDREELSADVNAATSVDLGLATAASLAVGASARRERYRIGAGERASWIHGGHPDQFGDDAAPGAQVFPGFSPADESNASRTNFGLFADLEARLTPRLLASVAGRFETYSDFGEVVTGKLAARFQPSTMLTLRGAVSTGFRAPGLSQIHFSKVVTNVIAGEFIDVGIFPVSHPASRALGAEDLTEERSQNLSAGFAVTPVRDLTITADYFRVAIKDRILLGATFDDDATLAILADAGQTDVGGVQYFTNGLDTRTQGVDVTATRRMTVGQAGSLDLTAMVNWTENRITRVDPLPQVLRDRGSTETGIIDPVTTIAIEEERPRWRWGASAEYRMGAFSAVGRLSAFGGFASAQPGFCDRCRDTYGAKSLFDAEVGYRFRQTTFALGARNLFDTYPDRPTSTTLVDPADPDQGTAADWNSNFGIFPWAAASPFGYNGRYVYARASVTLGR